MNRNARSLFVGATLLVSSTLSLADDLNSACLSHFTVEGSFLAGKKYNTWAELPGVSMADAYARIYATVAKDGWSIAQADKDSGVISATEQVSYGKGAQAPLTIVIETTQGGSKASITFRTAGGQTAGGDLIHSKFCNYLGSAASSQH